MFISSSLMGDGTLIVSIANEMQMENGTIIMILISIARVSR